MPEASAEKEYDIHTAVDALVRQDDPASPPVEEEAQDNAPANEFLDSLSETGGTEEANSDEEQSLEKNQPENQSSDDGDPQQGDTGDLQTLTDEYDDVLVQVGEEQITLKALKEGNFRQSDYSRKTQQLAEERRNLNQQALQQQRENQQRLADYLDQIGRPEEPDWNAVSQEAPNSLTALKLNYDKQVEAWKDNVSRVEQAREQSLQEFKNATADILLEKFPEIREKPEEFSQNHATRENIATEFGFTRYEIDNIADWRMVGPFEEIRRLRSQVESLTKAPETKRKPKTVKVQRGGRAKTTSDNVQSKLGQIQQRVRDRSRPLSAHQAADALFAMQELRNSD